VADHNGNLIARHYEEDLDGTMTHGDVACRPLTAAQRVKATARTAELAKTLGQKPAAK
jgi:hypothetical protein